MPRVLIVEDSPTQARQLALILEAADFEVETAPDAECAFERLARAPFDIVLSDLMLPGDSGFDLCSRIKTNSRLCSIPVVVCTSQADPVNVLRGLQAGADGFITKNRDPDEIAGCVRTHWRGPRHRRKSRPFAWCSSARNSGWRLVVNNSSMSWPPHSRTWSISIRRSRPAFFPSGT